MNTEVFYQQDDVEIDGVKIHFAKGGRGPTIVLVHGWCNNWFGWIPLFTHLKDRFTLYLIDLPGFGDSGDLKEYSIELQTIYLAGFIETLPDKPVCVVGLSMGSFVVGHMGRTRPDLTKSVVLCGPVLPDGKRANLVAKAIHYSFRFIDQSNHLESALKRLIEKQTTAYLVGKHLNMYKFDKYLIDTYGTVGRKKMRAQTFVQMGRSIGIYNLRETLQKYQLPVLLLYGSADKVSSPNVARKYLVPDNSLMKVAEIPQAGHVVPLEKPKETARAIKSFLKLQQLI